MTKKKLVFIAMLVAISIAGAFWFVNKGVNRTPSADNRETQSQPEKQANKLSQASCDMLSESGSVLSNGKVYNNESPRFSFVYPGNWSEKVEKKPNGEMSVSLHDPKKTCSIEGFPALCGVHVSVFPIAGEESSNRKYLKSMEEAQSKGQAQIKKVCVDGKEAFEIDDYLRHEIIFDRGEYSFMVTAENFGSDDANKLFWNAADSIGSGFRFE